MKLYLNRNSIKASIRVIYSFQRLDNDFLDTNIHESETDAVLSTKLIKADIRLGRFFYLSLLSLRQYKVERNKPRMRLFITTRTPSMRYAHTQLKSNLVATR